MKLFLEKISLLAVCGAFALGSFATVRASEIDPPDAPRVCKPIANPPPPPSQPLHQDDESWNRAVPEPCREPTSPSATESVELS